MRNQPPPAIRHPARQTPRRTHWCVCAVGVLLGSLALPATLHAANARTGVHPKPGEIVLLRAVPTRHAVRQAPPAGALLVDPTPNAQLNAALGSMEMSDSEAGAISAPVQTATRALGATLAPNSMPAITRGSGSHPAPRGTATNTTPLSVVGSATRGVGSTITGALQALPLGKPAGG